MEALKLASEGREVIYECPSLDMAKWTFHKATRIVEDFMVPEVPKKLVLVIGSGSVRFTKKLTIQEMWLLDRIKGHVVIRDLN